MIELILIIYLVYLFIKDVVMDKYLDKRSDLAKRLAKRLEVIPSSLEESETRNEIYRIYCEKTGNFPEFYCPKCDEYVHEEKPRCQCGYGKKFVELYYEECKIIENLPETSHIKRRINQILSIRSREEYLKRMNKGRIFLLRLRDLNELLEMSSELDLSRNSEEFKALCDEYLRDIEDRRQRELAAQEAKKKEEEAVINELEMLKRKYNIDPYYAYPPRCTDKDKLRIVKDIVKKIEERKEQEHQKYLNSFDYKYKTQWSGDPCVKGYREYEHKVEITIDISVLPEYQIEDYIKEWMGRVKEYLVIMSVIVNNNKKKEIVKKMNCKRIQKRTCYSHEPNKIILLIEPE